MSKSSTGRRKQDRKRVAFNQDHELYYLKEKHGISGQQIAGAIRAVGNSRVKIEKYLKDKGTI